MPITIKTEKVIANDFPGGRGRKIISIQAIRYNDLPLEYRRGDKKCYLVHCNGKPVKPMLHIWGFPIFESIQVDKVYSETYFQKMMANIVECGAILRGVNKERAKMPEGWSGMETFVI